MFGVWSTLYHIWSYLYVLYFSLKFKSLIYLKFLTLLSCVLARSSWRRWGMEGKANCWKIEYLNVSFWNRSVVLCNYLQTFQGVVLQPQFSNSIKIKEFICFPFILWKKFTWCSLQMFQGPVWRSNGDNFFTFQTLFIIILEKLHHYLPSSLILCSLASH